MKRILLTIALAVSVLTASYAQDAKTKATPAQKAEKSTAKLQKELSLTADQKQKVYALELDKFKKAEALHKKSGETKQAQKDEHDAVKKAADAQLDKILTADQKKKLAAVKAEKKDKKKDHKKKSE